MCGLIDAYKEAQRSSNVAIADRLYHALGREPTIHQQNGRLVQNLSANEIHSVLKYCRLKR
ncbi:hypothetical protein BMR11_16815 [Methylococcaceae bacterium CS5]|nr:hypothetical protein BMR11_16815 [Methylococcaceae bacterium CS5]